MQYIPSETPFIIRVQEPDVVGDHGNATDIALSAGKLVEVEIGDDQQDDGQHEVQVSEYESDSSDSDNETLVHEDIFKRKQVIRSGRPTKAIIRLDL